MLDSNQKVGDVSERAVLQHLCHAWNTLDVSTIEPFLDTHLIFNIYNVNCTLYSKEEYLHYLKEKFKSMSNISRYKVKADIVIDNGGEYVCIYGQNRNFIIETFIVNGHIQKMLIRPPYSKFLFDNFNNHFPDMLNIAVSSLNNYFRDLNIKDSHPWEWVNVEHKKYRYHDLCIKYEYGIYSIILGLYRKNIDGQSEYCFNISEHRRLLHFCQRKHNIPCMFLIDSSGYPVFNGCHMLDARSLVPLHLEGFKDCQYVSEHKINVF